MTPSLAYFAGQLLREFLKGSALGGGFGFGLWLIARLGLAVGVIP